MCDVRKRAGRGPRTAPRVLFGNAEQRTGKGVSFHSLLAAHSDSLYPRNGGGVGDPEALRHCAMLSAITFIDAAAVWLTVA